MKPKHIILEKSEYYWILWLIQSKKFSDILNQSWLETLQSELKSAIVKNEEEMPDDIVRLNSIVNVQTYYGPRAELQLVVPSESNTEKNKISILSKLGLALIGYSKGDEINWVSPNGNKKIRIVDVKNAYNKDLRSSQ